MTNGLRDPKLPAGWVVEVDPETGEGIRNDGTRLKPAAKNPWYVLMTIAGERDGEDRIDPDLHARNRRYWNGWACARMSDDERAALAEKMRLTPEDLAPLSDEEHAQVKAAFRERLGPDAAIPDPTKKIDFSKTHFPHTGSWEQCVFPALILFSSATFSSNTMFESATFSGDAGFDSATFEGNPWFDSATFSGDADFRSATFSMDAFFESARFNGRAWFWSATFSDCAWFRSAKFSGDVGFDSATFSRDTTFESATFGGTVDFSDGGFGCKTDFAGVRFTGAVPKFYERKFHQDTDFTTEADNWPQIAEETARQSKRAYTRLRQIMNGLHKPDDEHFFGRQEMRCKELLEGPLHRWASRGFGLVSDYGHSEGRPLAWLAGLIAVFVPYFGIYLKFERGVGWVAALWQGLGLSCANTFAFFGFHRRFFEAELMEDMPGWLQWIAGLQTVLGFVLLFFLGLGLRNRFRLK